MIRRHPRVATLQILAARVIHGAPQSRRARRTWKKISERFPHEEEPLRMVLRWQLKDSGAGAARREYDALCARLPQGFAGALLRTQLLTEFRDEEEIVSAFEDLLRRYPDKEPGYANYAIWLRRRGHLGRAVAILREGMAANPGSARLRHLLRDLERRAARIGRLLGPVVEARSVGEQALARVLGDLSADRGDMPASSLSFLGGVAMITGSLGPGGAERQLTTASKALQAAAAAGRPIAGYDILGPVVVLCRSMRSRPRGNYFLPDLQAAGIEAREYQEFPEYGGDSRRSLAGRWRDLMPYLLPQIRGGTLRLADWLRVLSPQVVHIWQDGSVLAGAIAAVIAKVPRIVLSARTLPPVDRAERYRREYPILYRSLLAMPGITLSANSAFAANRYALWLGVPPERIPVVYNGVEPPAPTPRGDSEALWREFDARTGGSGFTVGTVMRFDDNKRPLLWLEAAAAFHREVPGARFILIGDGPLLPSSIGHAARLGIGERVLFAGHRADVGFWLCRFGCLLLLSRHEGLPNVLIEAQMAGVPVVCTPAGGSAEAVVPEGRDLMLPTADNVEVLQVSARLLSLYSSERYKTLSAPAKDWALATFSVERMMADTLDLYLG